MNKPITSSEKLRRLETAHDLFDGLLKDDDGYSPNVRKELKRNLTECESKIGDLKSIGTERSDIKNNEKFEAELKNGAAEYFTNKYQITLSSGAISDGFLAINSKIIKISSQEHEICRLMILELKKDWINPNLDDGTESGWVSYKEFEQKVTSWKNSQDIVPRTVNNAIYKINKKINKILGFKNTKEYLIENGKPRGAPGHYRFRVNPAKLGIES